MGSSGNFTIDVRVDGKSLQDSPTKLQVGNVPDTEKCSANGPGLEELTVFARDAEGQPTDGICTVEMRGPNGPVEVTVVDSGDGKFQAQYNPLSPGDYTVNAMIDSQPVSTFRAKIQPRPKRKEPEETTPITTTTTTTTTVTTTTKGSKFPSVKIPFGKKQKKNRKRKKKKKIWEGQKKKKKKKKK